MRRVAHTDKVSERVAAAQTAIQEGTTVENKSVEMAEEVIGTQTEMWTVVCL